MGQIVLTVNVQDGRLYIRIDDDGIGMTEEKLEQINLSLKQRIATGGVGMMNVNRRITLRYGAEYGLFVSVSEYGGLCTYIVLPEINFLTLQ